MTFDNLDQANRIMNLLMRFMNGIARAFMDDPAAFEPIYWRAAQWGAAEWCEGFLLGTQFNEDAWGLLWVGKPQLVTPFLRLGTDDGLEITRKAGATTAGWKRWNPPWSRFTPSGGRGEPVSRQDWPGMIFTSGSCARQRPARRQRSAATIPVRATAGRNTRNAAGRSADRLRCTERYCGHQNIWSHGNIGCGKDTRLYGTKQNQANLDGRMSFPRFFVFQPYGIMPPIRAHADA